MVLYEPVRQGIVQLTGGSAVGPTFAERLLAGGVAGGLAIAVFNPTEVVKVRLQAGAGGGTMGTVVHNVWTRYGIGGFWSGVYPNVVRTFCVQAAELGTYDQAKEILARMYPDSPFASQVGASAIAGLASAITSTPADVVKTRLMQNGDVGATTAIQDLLRNEGPSALYKGFFPIFWRKLIWCSVFFVSFEQLREGINERQALV